MEKPSREAYSGQYAHTMYMMGNVLATTISWSLNKSVWWAFLHGFYSWFYVGYYVFALSGK